MSKQAGNATIAAETKHSDSLINQISGIDLEIVKAMGGHPTARELSNLGEQLNIAEMALGKNQEARFEALFQTYTRLAVCAHKFAGESLLESTTYKELEKKALVNAARINERWAHDVVGFSEKSVSVVEPFAERYRNIAEHQFKAGNVKETGKMLESIRELLLPTGIENPHFKLSLISNASDVLARLELLRTYATIAKENFVSPKSEGAQIPLEINEQLLEINTTIAGNICARLNKDTAANYQMETFSELTGSNLSSDKLNAIIGFTRAAEELAKSNGPSADRATQAVYEHLSNAAVGLGVESFLVANFETLVSFAHIAEQTASKLTTDSELRGRFEDLSRVLCDESVLAATLGAVESSNGLSPFHAGTSHGVSALYAASLAPERIRGEMIDQVLFGYQHVFGAGTDRTPLNTSSDDVIERMFQAWSHIQQVPELAKKHAELGEFTNAAMQSIAERRINALL